MLYKKYVIEVVYKTEVIDNIEINSNNIYDNQIRMNFVPSPITINTIKFLAEDGVIQDYDYYFDTSDEAYEVLSTHYYTVINDVNVLTLKIVTVLNDLPPSPEVLRAMKIKNILD